MIRLPNIYTILPGMAFARTLAESLWDEYRDDLLALSDVELYLPNRRSVQALTDAFLAVSDGQAALLPRMVPIGDIDEDDLFEDDPFMMADEADILPAISPVERHVILMQLVMKWNLRYGVNHAHHLALQLAKLIDSAHTEQVDLTKIDILVPGDLAAHWQVTRDFLGIITHAWPEILKEKGLVDPAFRRNVIIGKKTQSLLDKQPVTRMIAAGSTGSIPATAAFLNAVARMPNGAVILPGLDPAIDRKQWDNIDFQHPYYFMKRLLGLFTIEPSQVKAWPYLNKPHDTQCNLQHFALSALQPKNVFDLSHIKAEPDCLNRHEMIQAEDPLHEARIIALILREAIENKGQTAIVVTPDRQLAKSIQTEMLRWNIVINDSGGETLDNTPTGIFMRLIAQYPSTATPATSCLAILRHFLTRFQGDNKQARLAVLESRLAHQIIPPGGLGILAEKYDLDILRWFLTVMQLPGSGALSLKAWVTWHVSVAETLGKATSDHPSALWAYDDGEATAKMFHTLLASESLNAITLTSHEYEEVITSWMRQITIRPRYGVHPRIRLLSPVEARMQNADITILAGLNDGVWPMQPVPNPWLSRPMRHELGFEDDERRIGQSALDFVMLFCAPQVYATWSRQREGVLAQPARWVQQIAAVMKKTGSALAPESSRYYHWARQWDVPARTYPQAAPAPHPARAQRPDEFWVTDIESWQKDPYSFYAKRILHLSPSPLLDRSIDHKEWGKLSHQVLEEFFAQDGFHAKNPRLAYDMIAGNHMRAYVLDPSQEMQWQNKLRLIGDWLMQQQPHKDAVCLTEFTFSYAFTHAAGQFTLHGRSDRVDVTPDGLVLTDYKTGKPPTLKRVVSGKAPQLPLLGWMAQRSDDPRLQHLPVLALNYVQLHGKAEKSAELRLLKDPAALINKNEGYFIELLDDYYVRLSPYEAKILTANDYDDYAQLKRVGEWASFSADDGADDVAAEEVEA